MKGFCRADTSTGTVITEFCNWLLQWFMSNKDFSLTHEAGTSHLAVARMVKGSSTPARFSDHF